VRNMATEIVHQHSILDSFHPSPLPSHASLGRVGTHLSCFLRPYSTVVSHSFTHCLYRRSSSNPTSTSTLPYTRSPPQIFFKHTLASFAHDHSRYVVCDPAQLVRTFLIGFFKQVLVATGCPSIARTTSSFLRLEVRLYLHIPSLLQFLKTFGTKMSRSHKWVRNRHCRL